MKPEDKIVYLDKSKASESGATLSLFDQVRQLTVKRAPALLRHMLDNVDDALFDRAEKAENNAVQTMYFDTMRQIRLKRRELEQGFQERIVSAFRALTTGSSGGDKASVKKSAGQGDDFSLVDNEALEESLAVEGMVAKARTRLSASLPALKARLDHLLGYQTVTDENNPLDPQQIASAFAVAIEVVDCEIQARLIIYKLFDKYVMSQLAGLYDEVNGMLIEAGVLPNYKAIGRPSGAGATSHERRGGQASAGEPASAAGYGPEPGSEDELFSALHKLLAERKYGGESGGAQWTGTGYTGQGAPAPVSEVVAALSLLQRGSTGDVDVGGAAPVSLTELDIKKVLSQEISRHSKGRVGGFARAEDDTIDIVSMLFDVILDAPNLANSIKALIARLQIPVLKVALLDTSFFGRKKHPARSLINELAQASIGWVEPKDVARDPLYQKIESIVSRILSEFEDDVTLFQELLGELRAFVSEDRERANLIEQRTRQAAEGKAKVDGAKACVDEEIRNRVAGRHLPDVVDTLINEAWSKVLFITYLKEGYGSEAWDRQIGVVERLLWSIEPKPTHEDRKQLLAEIPGLLHDLREGLNAILFNPFEMSKLFKALEAEHIQCLSASSGSTSRQAPPPSRPTPPALMPTGNRTRPETAGDDATASTTADPQSPVDSKSTESTDLREPVEEEEDAELSEYRNKLEQVAVGTWFEFTQDSGEALRAKLSARLSGGQRLIFVNRAGFKLADRRLDELADALRNGAASILDDNLLFDKALETVISNLRNLRAGQES